MTDRRIVVGVDGSAPSLAAVDLAADEAVLRGLPIRVVYASASADRDAGQIVRAALCRVADRGGDPTGEVLIGDPGAVLVDESAGAELLVVGHRGRGGFPQLLAGSTCAKVAAYARCPVLVARGTSVASGNIVVGVDGSAANAVAIGFACEEANLRGAVLEAVLAATGPVFSQPGEALLYDARYEESRQVTLLARAVEPWHEKYPRLRVRRTVRPVPASRALVQASQRAALAVVGSRGGGGFDGLRLGSVAYALLHHAACPVAVVPAGDLVSAGRPPLRESSTRSPA